VPFWRRCPIDPGQVDSNTLIPVTFDRDVSVNTARRYAVSDFKIEADYRMRLRSAALFAVGFLSVRNCFGSRPITSSPNARKERCCHAPSSVSRRKPLKAPRSHRAALVSRFSRRRGCQHLGVGLRRCRRGHASPLTGGMYRAAPLSAGPPGRQRGFGSIAQRVGLHRAVASFWLHGSTRCQSSLEPPRRAGLVGTLVMDEVIALENQICEALAAGTVPERCHGRMTCFAMRSRPATRLDRLRTIAGIGTDMNAAS
jgi:hypothetical protein